LNEAEVQAALQVIDLNKDGSISFDEFVKWWVKDDMAA
jgi:Ca2+-binding EF-hand superfamily protein